MTIDVRADAFLRGMVRRIVAVLLEVGRGKMDETAVRAALAAGRPALDGAAAPAQGALPPAGRPRTATGANATTENDGGTMNAKTYTAARARSSGTGSSWTRRTRRSAASRRASRASSRASTSRPTRRTSTPATTSSSSTPRKIAVTSDKLETKLYTRHSGHPQGYKEETLGDLLERRPEEVIRRAVKGMLPHNRLGVQQLRKLKIYAGTEHPHQAQRPEPLA